MLNYSVAELRLNLQLICVLAHYCTKSYNNKPKKKRTTIKNGENQN